MGIQVQKGGKVDITKNSMDVKRLCIEMSWKVSESQNTSTFEIDSAAFLLGSSGKASKDEDFIFYNNPNSEDNAVIHVSNPNQRLGRECIKINLEKISSSIEKVAFTITIHEAEAKFQSFKHIKDIVVRIVNEDTQEEILCYNIGEIFTVETAMVAAEIYKYKGEWKFNAIGSGFKGGLSALCENFGIEVEEGEKKEPKIAMEIKEIEESNVNLSKINLLKKKVGIVLEKKKLTGVIARVALVLDISGSMRSCYKKGIVQNVVDRITAIASHFDDDRTLDIWMFDHRFHRLPAVTEYNHEGYIEREILGKYKKGGFGSQIFGMNDEPLVIMDVIQYYTRENKSKNPDFVVFISDGGIHKNSEIKKIITNASQYPLFWQFVGIGNGNYGILEKLDTMSGRVVDNANFFALDDIESISDEELYNRLLNEFPTWLKEAKIEGIL